MSALGRLLAAALSLCLLIIPARAEELINPLNQNEKLELEIYRKSFPELQRRLTEYEKGSPFVTPETYKTYLDRYYQQQTEMGEITIRAFRWQRLASDVILALMTVLTLAGIVLAGYQLKIAAELARRSKRHEGTESSQPSTTNSGSLGESSIEFSANSVRVQSSVIGVLLLVFSGLFLIFFLQEVYRVRVIDLATPERALKQSVSK